MLNQLAFKEEKKQPLLSLHALRDKAYPELSPPTVTLNVQTAELL